MPFGRHRSKPRLRALWLVLVTLASSGWLGCADDGCASPEEEKAQLLRLAIAHYFFNGEVDQQGKYDALDLAEYASAFDLLDELRYEPEQYDRYFSYITTPAIEAQVYEAGISVAFGVGLDWTEDARLFIRSVSALSPAEIGGLHRGDEILEIEGRTIAEIDADPGTEPVFGPPGLGVERSFLIRPVEGGADYTLTLAKDAFPIDLVPDYGVFDDGSEPVGYVLFNGFIPLAAPQLSAAFDLFALEGVTKLVIDLRYNGGGSLPFAATLINELGGVDHDELVQFSQRYDSAAVEPDVDWLFNADEATLDLERVVVITGPRTASASELLINALGAHLDVRVVGATTAGKPVGQHAFDYCGGDYRLRLVTFDLLNALGEGEYYDGIEPTCPAADDLGHALGDPLEASLSTALTVAETGICPAAEASAAIAGEALQRPGWLGRPPVPWIDVL